MRMQRDSVWGDDHATYCAYQAERTEVGAPDARMSLGSPILQNIGGKKYRSTFLMNTGAKPSEINSHST
jgi:hypothetical protein